MAIEIDCACGQHIRFPLDAAGRQARCRNCGHVFVVPAPKELDAPPQFVPPDAPRLESHVRDHNIIVKPKVGFWHDLARTFILCGAGKNWAVLLGLALMLFVFGLIPMMGWFAVIFKLMILGYVCAFISNTILETASGEDDLPNVWISDPWEDLVMPLLHLVGSVLLVIWPAIVLGAVTLAKGWKLPPYTIQALAMLGLFFWPVVILSVSIGGGFDGMYPWTIMLTALASPLAYLAICACLFATFMLVQFAGDWVDSEIGTQGWTGWFFARFLTTALPLYLAIVSSRSTGLFYRHFKRRFPWVAE